MTFLYKSSLLYHGLMTMVYHVHRRERFEEVARWVPRDAEVLDVCCGDGSLSTFLPASVSYRGLDESTAFIKAGSHRGRDLRHFNLMAESLPVSQIVICQVSLFQFYPKVEEVVGRLFAAADRALNRFGVREELQSIEICIAEGHLLVGHLRRWAQRWELPLQRDQPRSAFRALSALPSAHRGGLRGPRLDLCVR